MITVVYQFTFFLYNKIITFSMIVSLNSNVVNEIIVLKMLPGKVLQGLKPAWG